AAAAIHCAGTAIVRGERDPDRTYQLHETLQVTIARRSMERDRPAWTSQMGDVANPAPVPGRPARSIPAPSSPSSPRVETRDARSTNGRDSGRPRNTETLMAYIDGFVLAVPAENKETYRKIAADAVARFKHYGATRLVEAWGDDVPDGKVTDFKGAVKAQPGEAVVFSWIEYPDKATRDQANETMMADPSMKEAMKDMPFDAQRMIYGGFTPLSDDGRRSRPGYVDGFVTPVPATNQDAY